MTNELMIPSEWIELITILKKRRGKHTKVFGPAAKLTKRLGACERVCDVRFEVLLQLINELMRAEAAKHRPTPSRAKTANIRRRCRAHTV
jgi:hypothetical protein